MEQNKGSYGSSSGTQHDALVRRFEATKAQVERLTQDVLTRLGREGKDRHRAAAEFKAALTENLLRRLGAESDPRRGVEEFLGLDVVRPYKGWVDRLALARAAGELAAIVREAAKADPPGALLVPERGEPFDADRHLVPRGCEQGGAVVRAVFPGYEIVTDVRRVCLKADVLTAEEATPDPSGPVDRLA